MKYFTKTIPISLAEKLKEKGMPMPANYADLPQFSLPTFGYCFDWLMEKGLFVVIEPHWDFADEVITKDFDAAVIRQGTIHTPTPTTEGDTWHEAANAAIEMALTLI